MLSKKFRLVGVVGVAAVAVIPAGIGLAANGPDTSQTSGAAQIAARETPVESGDPLDARLTTNAADAPGKIVIKSKSKFVSAAGSGVLGTGVDQKGVGYTCYEFPDGSGGCSQTNQIKANEPIGSVTAMGNGKFSVIVLLPGDTQQAMVSGPDSRERSDLTVVDGVAAGVITGSGWHTLRWTSATGGSMEHKIVTP